MNNNTTQSSNDNALITDAAKHAGSFAKAARTVGISLRRLHKVRSQHLSLYPDERLVLHLFVRGELP